MSLSAPVLAVNFVSGTGTVPPLTHVIVSFVYCVNALFTRVPVLVMDPVLAMVLTMVLAMVLAMVPVPVVVTAKP